MHRVVRGNRLTRIAPEAIEHVVLHQSVLEEPVVHVSDLELSAPGRLELGQHIPYRRVIKVNARDSEVAGRLLGLLDNPFDPALAVELGDAQVAKVLVIEFPGENDTRAALLLLERIHARTDRALEDVVSQEHDTADRKST